MRILHLGDLHLGKSLGDFDLIDDQRYILKQIAFLAVSKEADAVLMAGDIYDKAIPSEAAVNLLDEFLGELVKAGKSVFIISGNHDSDDRLNFGSRFFETNHIYISSVFQGKLFKKTLSDPFGEVDVYLLPFVKASQVRHFFPDADIRSYEDAVRTVLQQEAIDPARRSLLMAHQFVAGKGEDPVLGGSESAGVQSVGLVEKIGCDCFDSFDYTALGHIHSPQKVGREEVRYSGSPLKYSLSEADDAKSVPLITLEEKGTVQIELIPLKPRRDLRRIRGPLEKLLSPENVVSAQDYMYITLTDEDMTENVMHICRQIYPNTVKIDYDNSHTRQIEQVDIAGIAENRSFSELISDFYRQIYGCDMSDDEMDMMRQAAKEAGIISETG